MAETSKYSIIVSERATQMLLSHITFLSQVSLTAASKLVQDFDTQIQSLEFMPMRRPFFNADYIPQNTYHFILMLNQMIISKNPQFTGISARQQLEFTTHLLLTD